MTAREMVAQAGWNEGNSRRAALLMRLSTEPGHLVRERRGLAEGAAARMQALLNEIDETVLPRALHLKSGEKDVACLVVSHRRLIDIEMRGRSALPNDPVTLPQLLAARLIDIAQTRGDLAVTVGPRRAQPDHAETACSVASLRQALALVETQTAFDRLLHLAQAQSTAITQWDMAAAGALFSGPDTWKKPLQALTERFLAMGRDLNRSARVGTQGTQGAAIPISAQQIVILASLDKRGFAAVLPYQVGLRLIVDWQNR